MYANEMTGSREHLDSFRMGTGHWKDQAMLRSLGLSTTTAAIIIILNNIVKRACSQKRCLINWVSLGPTEPQRPQELIQMFGDVHQNV